MPGQDMSYPTVEEGVVGGENGTSGHAEDDLDSFVLEAAKERVCSCEFGWFCHGGKQKTLRAGGLSARKVCMRALLDKQEYVGGWERVLHVRLLSKQLGESNVKTIGR
jgi:hypothetical protein